MGCTLTHPNIMEMSLSNQTEFKFFVYNFKTFTFYSGTDNNIAPKHS